jgi:hypothetical protein
VVILTRYLSRRTKRRSGRDAECLASQHTTDTFKVPSQPFLSLRSSSTIQSKNGLGQFTQTLAGLISTISSITRYVIDINHTSLFKELLYCNCLIGLAHQFKRGPKWELFRRTRLSTAPTTSHKNSIFLETQHQGTQLDL